MYAEPTSHLLHKMHPFHCGNMINSISLQQDVEMNVSAHCGGSHLRAVSAPPRFHVENSKLKSLP